MRACKHAQVVVDLGDGAHDGPGVARRALLVDGDGRRRCGEVRVFPIDQGTSTQDSRLVAHAN